VKCWLVWWGERPREPEPCLSFQFCVNIPKDNELPKRKNPSSGVHFQFGQSNIIFLTITTERRRPWLANATAHRFLHQTWSEITAWLVGDYLLMPDHLHLFCAPRDLHFTIEGWIAYWKRSFKSKHKQADWKFQSRGWHHRLRNGENHSTKWLYIQENPLRKGLVNRIEDWPFKGKVFDLMWSGK
jgi:putative transposase